jgi:hypothetical protein
MARASNRAMIISGVVALTVVGVLAGILADPKSDDESSASIVVTVSPSSPGIRVLQEVVSNPEVVNTALGDAGISADPKKIASGVTAVADPADGIVTITVPADSDEHAVALIKSLTAQGLAVAKMAINRAQDAVDYSFGDFEDGRASWDSVASDFNRSPRDESITSPGFTNSHALEVECDERPRCGPSVVLRGLFLPEQVYTAVAFVRADDDRADVSMTLGADSNDYAEGRSKPLTFEWTPLTVRWTPAEIHSSAVLALPVEGPGGFEIDSVVLAEGSGPRNPSAQRFRQAERSLRLGIARSPLPSDHDTSASRVRWGILGGVAGLVIALGAVLAGWLAYGRLTRRASGRNESA